MTAVLPDEVFYHIFSFLDSRSLGNALQCSTTFYRIATAPALWEIPYALRWTTGDAEREEQRRTARWRQTRRIKQLEAHARRATLEKAQAPDSSTDSPFRYLRLDPKHDQLDASQAESAAGQPDFYRLFIERIAIDQQVLDTLYQQVEATHARIPVVTSLARRFGNDAKDVLTAVVEAQASCPSRSTDGLPASPTRTASTDYRINAYNAHLPTTLRSDTHHLVILHHAREILEHLQRRQAMHKIDELARMADDTPEPRLEPSISAGRFVPSDTETAVSLLTMFRGGEASYVEAQLDELAAACDLYLQQRLPDPSSVATCGLDAVAAAKDMALAICDFLADHGFRGARDSLFTDLDNHFLHHCFTTNRETLPLSLTLVFCGVATRLGLRASLCNFPMRILAFVMVDNSAPLPRPDQTLAEVTNDMFWLDVTEHTTVAYNAHEPTPTDAFARQQSWLEQRPALLDRDDLTGWIGRIGVPPSDDFWRPASPDVMVQRAARNILNSVQMAQIRPRNLQPGNQARNVIRSIELERRSARLQQQWTHLARVDLAFLSSVHGRTDAHEHDCITKTVAKALEGSIGGADVAEDETTWGIVRRWRSESMRSLITSPECWSLPAVPAARRFREWMDERAVDNDWTRVQDDLYRRADHWSEHEQQAAKYAAINALLRLNTQVSAREVDWIAAFLQSYFMLDVDVIEHDFLGIESGFSAEPAHDAGEEEGSEGSESSQEASWSRREEQSEGGGMVQNASVRVILRRMLQAVRVKDAQPPRVNRRARGDEEDLIGYRVGTVFRHHTYRYAGCILGWDSHCAAPEDWIVNMGVDRLPPPRTTSPSTSTPRQRRGGRHQPFYHSQVADGTRRYVAEVNIERVLGPIWIYGLPDNAAAGFEPVEEARSLGAAVHQMLALRGLGEYFRCFDQQHAVLRPNRDCTTMFPDDWSDNDAEQQHPQDNTVETDRLSEDGSW
ncbi:uncharacterized protein PAN0_007d3198 [Moesziomyces antarcticus]|uniref:Uncharacterized protein n=2 Tax=Pseudozyma antarctica TaxID=84753 RepID=A0A5C3FRN9_PSEA2|nr:uncharacterized protein PAN0_007d3198 [Moesziomyces antarcticus]GAK64982.1 conserved hypothetical protein [Moesziomyces antarcticus]SPO46029.1 uncharacterized protein PSANT_03715 [Moesziomyces antarcticus]